jgi:3-oxoacyl-[acyl-carrier protein] reductase
MLIRFDGRTAFRNNFVNTIAMRRIGAPQDIANAVTFLASDHATGGPLA